MTVRSMYRACIWLPLVIPATLVGLGHGLDIRFDVWPLNKIVQVLLGSLLYGGIPYGALALWATWWINGKSEERIRRQMLLAPLVMASIFVPLSAGVGFLVGQPGPFLTLSLLGALVILLLGYAYVGLVLLLRRALSSQLQEGIAAR